MDSETVHGTVRSGAGSVPEAAEAWRRADAFALLSCPTPETGKSKFSPLPAFS
ncbi:TPA: hypothetical protein ACGJPO_004112 [Escherichia coli]|uniref:hypothetical protein n=1 Tax=Escherichia coli TaxID=562 RepID=UPI0015580C9D|nr:hypothetical protein [Escherichia coli]MCZ9103174.1 hypothetical protein [Escherichia albertii]EFM9550475.1 hypothetical protein [Escherichia coli]EGM8354701.1 hypothetical protein [Escherichia coli]EIX2829617.1 hypothetical protein [Escherichia coli]EJH1378891.1 hypothetical protein [Escherichia coli]